MHYVTLDDLDTRLGHDALVQLTDDAHTGEVNLAVVEETVDGAEGEVHSHLARRYPVPLDGTACTEAVGLLRTIVLDLVEYRLHARRPPVPAEVSAKRARATAWLQDVAAGRVILPIAREGFRAAIAGDTRVLSREEMEDF
jgi:phage gp36-like protein